MSAQRRSFKRAKSLSEDGIRSFQTSNFASKENDFDLSARQRDLSLNRHSELCKPFLNHLSNQLRANSGSSSSTMGGSSICDYSMLPNFQIPNHEKNYQTNACEVYYLSPSKGKSKENSPLPYKQQQKKSVLMSHEKHTKKQHKFNLKNPHVSNDFNHPSANKCHISSCEYLDFSTESDSKFKIQPLRQNTYKNMNNKKDSDSNRKADVISYSNSFDTHSLNCTGSKTADSTANQIEHDQFIDNFDIRSHYSDSVTVVTKNNTTTNRYYENNECGVNMLPAGNIRSNNVTFSTCTEDRYLKRQQSPSFSNFTQYPQLHQYEVNGAASDIYKESSHSNRGSLRRNKGRSIQSLCSCDAGDSTKIDSDSNRPLFQYSLDRKRRKHTYSCEQNAKILLRLERQKMSKNMSCGNLPTASVGKSSLKNHTEYKNNAMSKWKSEEFDELKDPNKNLESVTKPDTDIPPPPPPPCRRKLSLKQLHQSLANNFVPPKSIISSTPHAITAKNNYCKNQTVNSVAFSFADSGNNANENFNKSNNNKNFFKNNMKDNKNNNNYNNNNGKIDNYYNNTNFKSNNNYYYRNSNINNNNNNSNNNNIIDENINKCFKLASNTVSSNLTCNFGEQILSDCTSTILNCANGAAVGTQTTATATAQPLASIVTAYNELANGRSSHIAKLSNSHCANVYLDNNNPPVSDSNGNMKLSNQENIALAPYKYIRDDSYIQYFKNEELKKSSLKGEQTQPKAKLDNRIFSQNACRSQPFVKYNTIGPSNSYAKQLANHDLPKEFHNFAIAKEQGQEAMGENGTNLINGKYFSRSLTNVLSTSDSCKRESENKFLYKPFDIKKCNYRHWHNHNYNHFGNTSLPYTQFQTNDDTQLSSEGGIGNSAATLNGGLSCSFDNSMISCSFSTIGSGNSGLRGANSFEGKSELTTCRHLKDSSTALSSGSGLSLMPWKRRQCGSSRGSTGSSSNSLQFDFAKHWLAVTSILLLIGAASVAVPLALRVAASAPFEERLQIATQILETVPLIDGHNDLPWNIRKFLHNKLNDFNFDEDLRNITPWAKSQWSHTDLQRLRNGRVSAQFWAAYVPCEAQHRDAVQLTLEQIDVIKRLTERYSQLTSCVSAAEIIEAHKAHKLCSLTGVEGGHSLGGSLAVLRTLYAIGVRYMTLTSTCHTPWADSSYADAPTFNVKHGGLTSFGKTIIREMNRLGMIVDLSHVSTGTMRDALSISEAPVIFSHSSAYELCNSSRNVKDDILLSLASNGGIVMVNFYSKFLSCNENSTVHDAVAHINHIRRVAGIDHVGLGAGFDGINFTPKGLEDVSTYPTLFAELLGEGWSVDELKKLAGENFLRVLREVERIRDEKKKAGVRPYEDHPNFRTEDPFNCTSS